MVKGEGKFFEAAPNKTAESRGRLHQSSPTCKSAIALGLFGVMVLFREGPR